MSPADIKTLIEGIRKYTDFLGYHIIRSESGPHMGHSPMATRLIMSAYNAQLIFDIDMVDGKWTVEAKIVDKADKNHFRQTASADIPTVSALAEKVRVDILEKLPRNQENILDINELFKSTFANSVLYTIAKEFKELFNK